MYVSELLAIASAACIALSSMFVSELKGRVPVFQLARWQMLAAFAMTALASAATGGWRTIEAWQVLLLAGSGICGIAIASTTYFSAIYSVGPRVTALLFSLTSPIALILGYLALGETISLRQGVGVALVLCGVVLAIGLPGGRPRHRPAASMMPPVAVPAVPAPAPGGSYRRGILCGIVTAFGQALGTLLARPAMAAGAEPFTVMALRSGVAALFFLAVAAFPFGRGIRSALRPDTLGLALASSFLGTAFGMSLLMAALHRGDVGIVSTLSSVTPVVILPMVWLRTGEAPSGTAWLGALLAIAGTGFISIR